MPAHEKQRRLQVASPLSHQRWTCRGTSILDPYLWVTILEGFLGCRRFLQCCQPSRRPHGPLAGSQSVQPTDEEVDYLVVHPTNRKWVSSP